MEHGLRLAPWGVLILVLYGIVCTLLAAVSMVDDVRARHEIRAARQASTRFNALIDSLSHAPYVLSPRDSLRRRYVP